VSWAVQKFKVRSFYYFACQLYFVYCYNFPARVSRVVSLFGYADDAFCLEDIFVFLKAEEAFFCPTVTNWSGLANA